jgi:hypothetical protein
MTVKEMALPGKLGGAFFYPMDAPMNLVLTNLPSWLQAFAAIVALFIAVWGTLRADKAAKRRDRLQARCIATAIYPDILSIEVGLGRVRGMLKQLVSISATMVGQHYMADLNVAQIEIPPLLTRNVDNLYLLGEQAGPTCLQLVSVILQYNDLVQSAAAQLADKAKGEWTDLLHALEGHLTAIETLLGQAQKEIGPVHDPQ